jgi:RNA polymerase sigma-70 factor, ECF subfamily
LLNEIDDRPIARKAKQGDDQAFRILLDRYFKRIFKLVYRITHDVSVCEDITQEAFIRAFQNLEHYNHHQPFYPWMCRIAVNLSLNHLRDKKEVVEFNEHIDIPVNQLDTLESIHRDRLVDEVNKAIEKLSPPLRAALVLRVYEDMSYKEIAIALETNLGTVMSRIHRAREEIKTSCSHLLEDDDE